MFNGDSEDFAVGFKDGARAGGRDVGILNLLGGFDEMRTGGREIAGDVNRDRVLFAGNEIEEME